MYFIMPKKFADKVISITFATHRFLLYGPESVIFSKNKTWFYFSFLSLTRFISLLFLTVPKSLMLEESEIKK